MADDQIEQPQPQVESTAATAPSAADQKITLDLNELKSFMKSTVEEVLNASKLEDTRKQVEDYNNKIAESVRTSQASLIKPTIPTGQTNTEYVQRVIEEDSRRRFQSGEGRALYSDKGEDFIKAKIILLKKIGLTNEEIANTIKDII